MCIDICVYEYMHVCSVYVCMYAYVSICIYMCVYEYTHVFTSVYMYGCVRKYVCMCLWIHVCL
jgi:hypothetical protein